MAQTFSKILTHVIFSTKRRERLITSTIKDRICAYMTAIIDNEFGKLLRINAVADHVHLLMDIRPLFAPADVLRVVKSRSSKWIHETFSSVESFAWQAGYGIFSVSES